MRLLSFILCALWVLTAQSQTNLSGNVGSSLQIDAPASTSSSWPDLYSVAWSKYSGDNCVTLSNAYSSPVTVHVMSEGKVRILCHCEYYNKNDISKGKTNRNTYYDITCIDPNSGGGGSGGTSGGGTGGGSGSDEGYFYDYTEEGYNMLFYKAYYYGDCAKVIKTPDERACISTTTAGKVTVPNVAKNYPVRIIGNWAFSNLPNITDIVLPQSTSNIEDYCVYNCPNLKTITCLSENPPSCYSTSFMSCEKMILYVKSKSAKEKYAVAEGWKWFKEIKVIGESDDILITSITLSPSSASLTVGDTQQLTATISPSNATNKDVTWSSSNSSVATVSSSGLVTAKSAGNATITCKANDNSGKYATCSIIVENKPEPTDTKVKMVSAGGGHTMILKTDGTLWACGDNSIGQLCDGTHTNIISPKQIMTNVETVSAGYSHTMILKKDGSLWACGDNDYGCLGDGTMNDTSTPMQVMTGVKTVSAGTSYTMILKTDGSLWACGRNFKGQMGIENYIWNETPMKLMTGVKSVSTGGYHTMILKTDGSLWACGRNSAGQLGDGTTTDRRTPVQVMSGVASMSAGGDHSMIVKNNGSLWACGDNTYGQLGISSRRVKTPELIMTDISSVSAGHVHTMILKTDGSLWACGYNEKGALGDGTKIDRDTPVKIIEGSEDSTKGTEAEPFTPAEANAYGSTLAKNEESEQDYYIRGMVSSIKEQFGTQYGNATFYISADGTEKDQFYIYRALYLGNTKYAGQDLNIRIGDDVVIRGKITNYLGTLPETVQSKAYVVSINGETTGIKDVIIDQKFDAPIYNIQGQRLAYPRKGINIINGKKIVVK